MNEHHGTTGRLTLTLRDLAGKIIDRRQVDNLITDAGKHLVANLFTGGVTATPRLFIAVGLGDTVAKPEDTNLELPIAGMKDAEATAVVSRNQATVTATLPTQGDDADALELREAGIRIVVGDNDPVLYNRVTFPVVSKSPNMEMTLSWEVIF